MKPHREQLSFGILDSVIGGPAVTKVVKFESAVPFIYKLIRSNLGIGLLLAETNHGEKMVPVISQLVQQKSKPFLCSEPRVVVTALEGSGTHPRESVSLQGFGREKVGAQDVRRRSKRLF